MSAVSHSRVESYLSCRRKDYYGYQFPADQYFDIDPNTQHSRGIRRIRTSDSMALGSAVHTCLAAFYQAVLEGRDFADAVHLANFALAEQYAKGYENVEGRFETIETILQRYWDNEPFVTQGWEVLGVEQEFRLEYDSDTDASYPFVVDLIVRDPQGRVAVVDHKTSYYLFREEDLGLMPQIPKYIAGVRALGYPAAYGIYNVLRTQKVNGGKMLKAEVFDAICARLTELGKTPDEGALKKLLMPGLIEMAESLGIEPVQPPEVDQVLQQLEFNPSPVRVERTFVEQMGVSLEIMSRDALPLEESEATAWRTANKMVCNNCQFAGICSEELRGGNVKAALSNDYEPKPRREAFVLSNGEEEDGE